MNSSRFTVTGSHLVTVTMLGEGVGNVQGVIRGFKYQAQIVASKRGFTSRFEVLKVGSSRKFKCRGSQKPYTKKRIKSIILKSYTARSQGGIKKMD